MRTHSVGPPVSALAMLLILAGAPLLLWHRVLGDELASFHWSLGYGAAELGPWLLLLSGLAFMLPVALSAGLDPESRMYPRGRRELFTWGVSLYLLGAILAVEVFVVWNYAH